MISITGGAGYVGFSLAKHLAQSFEIRLLDIKKPSQELNDNICFQQCDVRYYEETKGALDGTDLVIHASIIQIPAITEQKKLAYEVNILGTQNVCRIVEENTRTKGLILSGSWHTIGERELEGVVDEEFGFRPDKVEERARLYALAKMAQESVVRFYDEMTSKIFGIIRMGTVLGEGMPKKTAANVFIENGIAGKQLTPFKHSMYRPMLYVDIHDICNAYEKLALRILNHDETEKTRNSVDHIFNVYHPEPVTIIELAEMVKETIKKYSNGSIQPIINVVDTGQQSMFNCEDRKRIVVDVSKALKLLKAKRLKSPRESIEDIVMSRLGISPFAT